MNEIKVQYTALWVVVSCAIVLMVTTSTRAESVNVIFDTDIGPDCDDAGSMAVLHALSDMGECHVLAMMCCTSSEWGAPCLDAINTYYGRPDIPIGTLKENGFLGGGGYNEHIAKNWPNDLQNGNNAPDATVLYRQILADQPDQSVVIIAVGPLRNLRNLLQSQPDQYSPLNGINLVAQKVKVLSDMGGQYPNGKEWNFYMDGGASSYVCRSWPTPANFSGNEIGSIIYTGSRLFTETPPDNPVRKAYEIYVGYGNSRCSWDQTACLYAVRGLRNYWTQVTDGYNNVAGDGANQFQLSTDRDHSYLVRLMSNQDIATVIDDLMVHIPVPVNAPDELVATVVTHNEIHLTWQDNSHDPQEDHFLIQRRPFIGRNVWTTIGQVNQNVTEYTDANDLNGLVTYCYRVASVLD